MRHRSTRLDDPCIRGGTRVVLAAALLLVATPDSAHAYVDPGSGALIFQIVMASLVGSIFFLRRAVRSAWERLRILLGGSPRSSLEASRGGSGGEA